MICWLIDTLVWTAVLIALVLVLRRPVTRHFGPQAAYALWLVPALRLLLPTITLPAAYRASAPVAEPVTAAVMLVPHEGAVLMPEAETALAATPIDLVPWLLAAWLTGAALFLTLRFSAYFRMRRELLAPSVPVGEFGGVRLVETPATNAPLAFGVIDKVVALPCGFMAQPDRLRRDLALEHELAHHAAYDLFANFAIQPLFAIHWFNPLGWVGWRAMRRDQEAACDARVLRRCGSDQRAVYAKVIAGFAAGPRVSLAAPMACPVLGEKSIIHRLRSLKMSELSNRRRLAGRTLLGAGLLALPLTASVTYAEAPAVPPAPTQPQAPSLVPLAPAAPVPPKAPYPPAAPPAPGALYLQDAPDRGEIERAEREVERAESEMERAEEAMAPAERRMKHAERRIEHGAHKVVVDGRVLEGEEAAAYMRGMEIDLEHMRTRMVDQRALSKEIRRSVHEALHTAPIVRTNCDVEGEITSVSQSEDGRQIINICRVAAMRQAAHGLREARAAIAREHALSEEQRERALRELDRELERLDSEG